MRISDLDKEHKYLIDIINQLYDYIGTHPLHKEKLIEKSNYPDFPFHHKEHQNFHNNIVELHKLYATDLLYAKNLLNTLQDWVINHICKIKNLH